MPQIESVYIVTRYVLTMDLCLIYKHPTTTATTNEIMGEILTKARDE